MRRAAFGSLLIALFLSSCAYFRDRPAPYRPPAVAQMDPTDDGQTLYMRDCAWCHGNQGQGTERGPNLTTGTNGPAMMDFVLTTGRMPLHRPDQRVSRQESLYTSREIDAMVEYTKTFGARGPDIPEPDPAKGDLGEGAELYQDNCAACHASTGIGGALSVGGSPSKATAIAPPLNEATPREVAESMLVGPGTMPVFGPETFTPEEVDSIVRYVEYLQEPNNRGGLPMGRIGPWSEGAAGWLVGVLPLILLVMWIGKKE
ncbi:MAG TPA: c-type cytochrome [Actinomycetota bacterium]|nr:c-type cytochrome [Actinomycetota bacterium]